jgi:hypothetical protein
MNALLIADNGVLRQVKKQRNGGTQHEKKSMFVGCAARSCRYGFCHER